MRAPVQRNDASIVDHLVENHHASRSLEKVNIIVVGRRIHWRSRVEPQDTTLGHTSVLRAVSRAFPSRFKGVRSLFCASGVKPGMLPSGGSIISEVRRVSMTFVPRSNQN